MLLFSYILVAALELVMTVISFQSQQMAFAWLFAILLSLSVLSIPLESSATGKMVRHEFMNMGIDTAKYDLLANNGRTLAYLLTLREIITFTQGIIMAYGISFYILFLVMNKYIQKIKK